MHIGVIGFGAIAQALVPHLLDRGHTVSVQLRSPRTLPDGVMAADDLRTCDLVVEAAGHGAVSEHVLPLLGHVPCIIGSVGALADRGLEASIRATPYGRAILPSGAVGALDMLGTLRQGNLSAVQYTSRKPPAAWASSPMAELAASATHAQITLFEGSAREAALRFPKNANVAATVALSGLGLDETQARLIADPNATGNTHEVTADSTAAAMTFQVTAKPSANAASSATVALSLLHTIERESARIVI